MPDLVTLLRRLADEYEKEERDEKAGEVSKATEDRIAALEAQIAAKPSDEKADAIEELSDDEWELIQQHRGKAKETPGLEPQPEPEPEPKTRPRQRVTEAMPQIWAGQDEPDVVEYEDDDGKVKTRKGRKRGQPYGWHVEDVADETEAA